LGTTLGVALLNLFCWRRWRRVSRETRLFLFSYFWRVTFDGKVSDGKFSTVIFENFASFTGQLE
jgi:hypothetical protein